MIKTKNRYIKTKIPNLKSINIINRLKKNEPRGMHGQFPIVWKKRKISVFSIILEINL